MIIFLFSLVEDPGLYDTGLEKCPVRSSVFINILCVLERNVYYTKVSNSDVKSILSLIFCLLQTLITGRRVLNILTKTVNELSFL